MDISPDLSPEALRLFADRIGRGLDERPLTLDAAAHRQVIAALVGRVGEASFYDLLDVNPGASQRDVHESYERLARLVHPRHAGDLGLAGKEGIFFLLFERATQGYLTLSHPDRRKDYDRELGSRPWSPETWGSSRDAEEQETARRYFVQARVLAAQEEYHPAIELMRQAARIDPRPEYLGLLGQLLAKNPHWLGQAADTFRKAIELGSMDPAVSMALEQVQAQIAAQSEELLAGADDPAAGKSSFKRMFRRT
ncbi:MAG TPA: DnaJ domain-containing protein [Thermoanaerobaculia bacterium]|nr:DnaJ domain-containing protein [Thermoanaerobaculia bacterium]